ncbi:MAG: hypothetical protein MUE53_03955 [Chitinophagales bacterium]|jgi:hypothetical protein|nr:hypothetical protein [Chitinophagales bacterium]
MKRTIFTLLLIAGNLLFFILGCCKEGKYRIIGIKELVIYNPSKPSIDSVQKDSTIFLTIVSKDELAQMKSINLNALYALSPCPVSYLNPFLPSSVELKINKAITYNQQIIPPNSNLIPILNLKTIPERDDPKNIDEFNLSIILDKEILEQIEFELGETEFYCKVKTSDLKEFSATKVVFIQ